MLIDDPPPNLRSVIDSYLPEAASPRSLAKAGEMIEGNFFVRHRRPDGLQISNILDGIKLLHILRVDLG